MFPRSKSQDRTFAEVLADNLNNENKRKSNSDLRDTEEIEHPFRIEHSDSAKPDEYDDFLLQLQQDPRSCKLLQSPLGRILLSQTAYIVEIAKKSKTPLGKSFFDDTVKEYNTFLEEHEATKPLSSLDIDASIKAAIHENMLQQHNEVFDQQTKNFLLPPFPDHNDTLFFTDQKLSLVNNTFPVRQKFSGKDNPSIVEFLRNIKNAQLQCQLTESQFASVFLRCFTGPPYEMVSNALDGNLTINEIISSLLIKYDKRVKPEEAIILLHNYKPPSNATYDSVVSDILNLAQRACSDQPDSIKNEMYNYTAIEALLKNLPPDNKADGEKTRMKLVTLYNRPPTFDEFSRSLRKIATAIDLNYKRSKHAPSRNSFQIVRPSSHVKSIRPNTNFIRSGNKVLEGSAFRNIKIQEVSAHQKYNNFSNNAYTQNKPYAARQYQNRNNYNNRSNYFQSSNKTIQHKNPNFMKMQHSNGKQSQQFSKPGKPRYNNNYNNTRTNNTNNSNKRKLHCLLCGKGGHTATDFCFEMRTDSGNFALVNRVPDPCPQCLADTEDELFHPDDFCPRRPRALFLKSNNQWPAPSFEIKEQMKKQLATFHK